MFRYPGGKSTIKNKILKLIQNFIVLNGANFEFREPFFGGGSVGLAVLQNDFFKNFWFNDIDESIICLWKSVQKDHTELIKKINLYNPSVQSFFEIKTFFENNKNKPKELNYIEYGFLKLVIQQISYSGLGVKAGGPIGGKKQKSKYDVGCRWNKEALTKTINKLNKSLNKISRKNKEDEIFTNSSFEQLIKNEENCILYLDPPYFIKGKELYPHFFEKEDHEYLRELLLETKNPWILSYDDCEEIRKLYKDFADIKKINIVYSIKKSIKKNEILITSKSFNINKINQSINLF